MDELKATLIRCIWERLNRFADESDVMKIPETTLSFDRYSSVLMLYHIYANTQYKDVRIKKLGDYCLIKLQNIEQFNNAQLVEFFECVIKQYYTQR